MKDVTQQTVLVVDDEEAIAEAVRARLQSEGFQVAVAGDGPEAIALCEQVQPDLVVLDLMLPGMDGLEVCRQIQRDRWVPVLMLTARTEEADKVAGFAVGADDYLTKPFSLRELVVRVRAILRRMERIGAEVHPDRARGRLCVPRARRGAMRPLDKLPTIRAKLGSTIVFAVGMTIVLVYFLLGFALRSAFREADLGRLARVATRAAASDLRDIPNGVTVVLLRDGSFTWYGPEGTPPPTFQDGRVHLGVAEGIEYAAVPVQQPGQPQETVYAIRDAPGVLGATLRFLSDFRWPLLVAGAIAAAIALVLARWLARGMTQPLRDMAQAARRME